MLLAAQLSGKPAIVRTQANAGGAACVVQYIAVR
jgi:hypothetical protein